MDFLNLVGKQDREEDILEKLILTEHLHLHLNYSEVYEDNFTVRQFILQHFGNEYLEKIGERRKVVNTDDCPCEMLEDLLGKLADDFQEEIVIDKKYLDPHYGIEDVQRDLMNIKEQIAPISEQVRMHREEIKLLLDFKEHIQYILGKDINFEELEQLHYMTYELGVLSKENHAHIKRNYENISALVWRIGKKENEDVYLMMYPNNYKTEVDRILKSVNWIPLHIPQGLSGKPTDMVEQIIDRIDQLEKEIDGLQEKLESNKSAFISIFNKCAARIAVGKQIKYFKQSIQHSDQVFVVSGWIPVTYKEAFDQVLESFGDDCVVTYRGAEELKEAIVPPTKLRNHKLFKPFETIVQLYGLPVYNEFDPTLFLSITYWLMFGMMFGDIGQGFVFFLAGLLLNKKSPGGPAGGILTRLGSSSMFFGVLYGSFFGLEDLPWLPHIIGSPLHGDNIPKVLAAGVIFGVIVLSISYVLGIINALRRGNIEEGVFGKNGIVGYLFFLGLVMTLVGLMGYKVLPLSVSILVMVTALIVIIFKQPLSHIVGKIKPLHKEDPSAYYVESGFETIETILSTLSNTISFIRVGAFALNHAGLFLAFMVMSRMTSNIILQFLIIAVGNIIILVLEGLIVFIQGLRLEYYEMFGKYFTGGGKPYQPVSLTNKR